jgi:Tfp pilus assembly protein PilO
LVKSRTQLSIYVVGGMLVADFVLFGYWPSRQRLEILQQTRAQQKSALVLAEVHRPQLASLQSQLARCEEDLAAYRGRIPVQRELGSFLQQVSDLMTQHHLKEQAIVPGEEAAIGGLIMVPVTVRCRGPLTDLFGFHRELASIGRLARLEKAQFTNDPDLGGYVRMEARMAIFYRPEAAPRENPTPGGGSSL